MPFSPIKLRVKELSKALNSTPDDIIAICIILDIPATSPLTSLSIDQCKLITDYYESHSNY